MLSSLQLSQEAREYKFNAAIPLRIYLKTCVGILDKAQLSFQTSDNSRAFMYYYRYVDLCTNKLSRHPELLNANKDPELRLYREEYIQLIKLEVPAVLRIIEDLKKQIDLEYEKHQWSLAKNIAKNPVNHSNSNNSKSLENKQGNKKDTITRLPTSFNEQKFQQSLKFLQGSSASKDNNSKPTTNNPSNTTTASAGSTTNNNESVIFHYPELPQLSFPTF